MMNVIECSHSRKPTFGQLECGDIFEYADAIYLKVFNPNFVSLEYGNNVFAVVLKDPYDRTEGVFSVQKFLDETVIDGVYSADLTLYD